MLHVTKGDVRDNEFTLALDRHTVPAVDEDLCDLVVAPQDSKYRDPEELVVRKIYKLP
jgi:hypothetical protein